MLYSKEGNMETRKKRITLKYRGKKTNRNSGQGRLVSL